jgi:hypothetical protein
MAYKEFDQHLLDSIEEERERRRLEGEKGEEVGGRQGETGLRRRRLGGREGGGEGGGEGERARACRRRENLFSLLVQANDAVTRDHAATEGGQEGGKEGGEEGGREGGRGRTSELDLQELLGNAFIFLLAGHETSAHTLVWAFLLLALHPDEQEAAFHEVQGVLGPLSLPPSPSSSTLQYHDLGRFPYCHGVMNEALRLFPPVVMVPKVCVADSTLTMPPSPPSPGTSAPPSPPPSFRIPKGADVYLHVFSLHRDSKYYPDPHTFRPERWAGKVGGREGGREGEAPAERDYFAFVPFSLGERSCLGRRVAHVTVMTTLVLLLHQYRVQVVEGEGGGEERKARMLETQNMVTLCPKDLGVQLVFSRRGGGGGREGGKEGGGEE